MRGTNHDKPYRLRRTLDKLKEGVEEMIIEIREPWTLS